MKSITTLKVFAFLLCLVSFYTNVQADPGDLDLSFGTNGIAMTNFGFHDYAIKSVIQPDGKIVVSGLSTSAFTSFTRNVSLARYNTDGSLDNTFGTNGKVFLVENGNHFPFGLLLKPDGKILVVGYESETSGVDRLMVYRFNSDGNLDATFGNNGKIVHSFGNACEVRDAVLQPDGKIVIVGSILGKFTVFRLNADGSLDTSFNSLGYNTVTSGTGYSATAVALQTDGKIVVGSSGGSTTGIWGRFNTDGTLEGNNLVQGILARDVAIQNDGKIVFVGASDNFSRPLITRFNADKTLDTKFGNFGTNTVYWNYYGSGTINSVLIESSGRIVVGGLTNLSDSTVARFNSNGFLDVGFGINGKVLTSLSAQQDEINGITQQADGKIIAVGDFKNTNDEYDYFVARYEGGASNTLPNRAAFDYDGDGRSDIAVFRPSENILYQFFSRTSTFGVYRFGTNGDFTTPADYDGDGRTDIAIFRPSSGQWWFWFSTTGSLMPYATWGQPGDIPLPSDFDGDGKADLILYRPSNSSWIRRGSAGVNSTLTFGISEDKPLIGDFDGDGKSDPAIYRPSTGTWWYQSSIDNSQRAVQWGISSDIPAPADYDGDGKTDFAVYRPSTGIWYILNSSGNYTIIRFGLAEDKPVPADYDGDGKADIALYRPSEGVWYQLKSTEGFSAIKFGLSEDIPMPNSYIY